MRIQFACAALLFVVTASLSVSCRDSHGRDHPPVSTVEALLDPTTQARFTNPLPIPPVYTPGVDANFPGADYYEVHVTQFQQWLGITDAATSKRLFTTVWGYGQVGHTYDTGVLNANNAPILQTGMYVAPVFHATKGKPVVVKWIDDRKDSEGDPLTEHLLESDYDTTIHGAGDGEPHVRMVTHMHGAEVATASDGFPEFWYTPDPNAAANGQGGPAGNFAIYTYPNQQLAAPLWYHDHTLGVTRLNLMAQGFGQYLLRDPVEETTLNLPSGAFEVPLVIADRMFNADGSLSYISSVNAVATDYHPKSTPEFFGNVITVNGMAWPFLNVEPRKYRFVMVNASNARMYNLRLFNLSTGLLWPNVFQVGSDGGYLDAPVQLDMTPVAADDASDATEKLFLAPAERADIVVDFSGLAVGTKLSFTNDARAPFPGGDLPDLSFADRILEFRLVPLSAPDTSSLPVALATFPTRLNVNQVTVTRHLALTEIEDPVGEAPICGLINNTGWDEPVEETPLLGATEIWEVANLTDDTHPIHLHLVQFNLLDRQLIDKDLFLVDWNAASPVGGYLPAPVPSCDPMTDPLDPPGVADWPQVIPSATPYLIGAPILPVEVEAGWKDTVRVKAGTVTRFLVKFAPQDPNENGPFGRFVFDPRIGSYVYHCHILEHEDNDMMRPYEIR